MKESWQKLNFFVASFLGIMGLSLASEIFQEDDMPDKLDDILFLLLGAYAVYWYRKNAQQRGIMPVLLIVAGAVFKFVAILIEHADKEAVGDDIGVFIALIIALVLVITQYLKYKKS